MTILEQILAGLQQKFTGVDTAILTRIATKKAEGVTDETKVNSIVEGWKIQCKLPPKTKRFCPLKTFNNAPLKSLDRWGYYYFRFLSVRLN